MVQLGMVRIGGSGMGKTSLFSSPLTAQFQGGPAMEGIFDWYSDQQYYNMAKAAVASFDQLSQRVSRIADKAARDSIISEYGMNTTTENKSLNLRNQVQGAIAAADATGDPGDGFADDGKHGRKPTDWLSSYVSDIAGAVQDAELKYGILQAPAVKMQPAAAGGSNWTIPIVAVGGAVALAAILGVFK